MKTQPKTVATIIATLTVATGVLSAPTQSDADHARQTLTTFKRSLYAWNTRPNCLGDQECARKELALLDQLVRDGNQYLGQSPVILALLWDAKAATGISEAELTKTAAVLQKCNNIAVMAKRFADAIHSFMDSHSKEQMEERRKVVVVERANFDQAVKELGGLAAEGEPTRTEPTQTKPIIRPLVKV